MGVDNFLMGLQIFVLSSQKPLAETEDLSQAQKVTLQPDSGSSVLSSTTAVRKMEKLLEEMED